MLDFESEHDSATSDELGKLDNGHLYSYGQREYCTVPEFVLAERLCDALDIIEILHAAILPMTSNDWAYSGTKNALGHDHSTNLNAVKDFLRSGKIDRLNLDADSAWRRG